jgi:glycyl-tRNA synthetase beta chain
MELVVAQVGGGALAKQMEQIYERKAAAAKELSGRALSAVDDAVLRSEIAASMHASLAEDPSFRELFVILANFFAERLGVALRDKGIKHDLIQAVFSQPSESDLVLILARVEALQAFLKTDDGANLLVAYRRAANILRIEEKKDKASYDGEPDPDAFVLPEEKALFVELATAGELVRAEIERERFVEAMGVMSRLRKPVDAFFEKVTVNDKDAALRKNRLLLLSRLRATLHLAADFSKIEG